MPRFEVRFSVPTVNEPGKALAWSSTMMQNMTTVVEAFSPPQATALVKAQYGPTTIINSCFQRS